MIMSKRYNWAVLGCGRIARKFSSDLKLLSNARLYASAARELKRAEEFAADLGFEKAYGSYEEMVADPAVDVVYVATPHSHHHDHVLLCLNAGKAVLNEKAFALTFAEAREMVLVAREKQIFLMEAFWTRFQPSFQKALEIVRSGDLGALKVIRSDFAFNAPKDPEKRLYNVSLGGDRSWTSAFTRFLQPCRPWESRNPSGRWRPSPRPVPKKALPWCSGIREENWLPSFPVWPPIPSSLRNTIVSADR